MLTTTPTFSRRRSARVARQESTFLSGLGAIDFARLDGALSRRHDTTCHCAAISVASWPGEIIGVSVAHRCHFAGKKATLGRCASKREYFHDAVDAFSKAQCAYRSPMPPSLPPSARRGEMTAALRPRRTLPHTSIFSMMAASPIYRRYASFILREYVIECTLSIFSFGRLYAACKTFAADAARSGRSFSSARRYMRVASSPM